MDPVREPQLVLPRPRQARGRCSRSRSQERRRLAGEPDAGPAHGAVPVAQQRRRPRQGSIDYGNTETHWWDGSQIYGSDTETQKAIRTFKDGKLKVGDDGRLLADPDESGIDLTGFNENYWFGLSCLHTMFTKEHNAICDVLTKENPRWDDQRLFDTAWLINAALMAKIHTVEWTPGIVNTPALWFAMNVNWSGIFGQTLKDRFGRLGDSEIFSGIMGSPQEHHDARFQLTEEFISVYRMHPLLRDDWNIFSRKDGGLLHQDEFINLQGAHTRSFMDRFEVGDLIYSMGVEHPGAITLHNYPRALQRFTRIDGELMDLATLDILRDRERGVPRYNDFREEIRMPRVRSFEELTPTTSSGPRRSAASTTTTSTRSISRSGCTRSRCRPGSVSRTPRSGSSS